MVGRLIVWCITPAFTAGGHAISCLGLVKVIDIFRETVEPDAITIAEGMTVVGVGTTILATLMFWRLYGDPILRSVAGAVVLGGTASVVIYSAFEIVATSNQQNHALSVTLGALIGFTGGVIFQFMTDRLKAYEGTAVSSPERDISLNQ